MTFRQNCERANRLHPMPQRALGGQTATHYAYETDIALAAYFSEAGWLMNVSDRDLGNATLPEAAIANLRSGKEKIALGSDRKIYKMDPYRPGTIIAYDPDRMPVHAEWHDARTSPYVYFEKHQELSKKEPQRVLVDFITEPMSRLVMAKLELVAAEKELAARPDDIGLRGTVEQWQVKVVLAQRTQFALERQFTIMRNNFFHTDIEENAAVARLQSLKGSGFNATLFRQRAKYKCTPEQIRELEAIFRADIASLPDLNVDAQS